MFIAFPLLSRPIHDNSDADETDHGSPSFRLIWGVPIELPSPKQRHDDKYSSISRINTPKQEARLEVWEDPIKYQHCRARSPEKRGFSVANPLPHKVATANFHQSCNEEQQNRFEQVDNYQVHINSLPMGDAKCYRKSSILA